MTGESGTRNGRFMSGLVRRSTGTATETTMKAKSVPMLTRSARALSGTNPASSATNTMVPAVMRYGVPHFGWTLATAGGSRRSRPMAKPIRPIARMSTRITEVRPQIAAIETSLAAQLSADLLEGVGDRRALADLGVADHPGQHERDADVEHGAQAEGAEQAQRQVAGGLAGLLAHVGHGLEPGVGEEDHGGGGEDAREAEGRRLDPEQRLPERLLQAAGALLDRGGRRG